MKSIRTILRSIIPTPVLRVLRRIKDEVFNGYARISYSQEGEDLILWRLIDGRATGTYVDVGACHPSRFSNTRLLYEAGWRGVNIDANPDFKELFNRARPGDKNIVCGVGETEEILPFFQFDDPAVNTFDAELARFRWESQGFRQTNIVQMPIRRLSAILNEVVPMQRGIDVLTIDVEGRDMEVLRSNDWNNFRPQIVLVEDLAIALDKVQESEVVIYMSQLNFLLVAKTRNTLIFESRKK